jgi:hypothetical protein
VKNSLFGGLKKPNKTICWRDKFTVDMEEVWRPIKRYEGLYEVSSYWRVRSVDRYDRRGTFHKGRILRIRKSGIFDGLYVTLSKNGVRKERDIGYILVHAFEDCDNLQEILERKPDIK